jgi:hypothetical protein
MNTDKNMNNSIEQGNEDASGEGLVQELIGKIAKLEERVGAAQRGVSELTLTRMIERRLIAMGAIDPEKHAGELARELAERGSSDAPTIEARLTRLRQDKPGAFRASARAGVMGPGAQANPRAGKPGAGERVIGGDRRSLAEYLRARRQRGK